MDDRLPSAAMPRQTFLCPGSSRPIERSVHLARLASFDPTCLACAERHDTAGLHAATLAQRAELERRTSRGWRWTEEALEGVSRGLLDRELPRRFAYAVADRLWLTSRGAPRVQVGSNGRLIDGELTATICHGLRLAGCDVAEVGAVTTAALSHGIARFNADGGIWIGNAEGGEHEVALLAFGPGGLPWSRPGVLAEIFEQVETGAVRPRRHGGSVQRVDIATGYLDDLRSCFHGLRALQFVLHSSSRPLWDWWREFSRDTALRIHGLQTPTTRNAREGSGTALEHEVLLQGAHFGLWVDGAGEHCEVVDERGVRVAPARLMRLLWNALGGATAEPFPLQSTLQQGTRQQQGETAQANGSPLAGDGQGRYWLAGRGVPDALGVACSLLVLLSRSDRTLSEVLDSEASER